jgi:hypothetical protein
MWGAYSTPYVDRGDNWRIFSTRPLIEPFSHITIFPTPNVVTIDVYYFEASDLRDEGHQILSEIDDH